MSLTDELTNQMVSQTENLAPQLIKAAPGAVKNTMLAGKTAGQGLVSGIVLIFKAPKFTADIIMQAVGKATRNPIYSKSNVSVEELSKNKDIRQLDEGLVKSQMRFFDKACRKYGITYNAVVDKGGSGNPTYRIFFRGNQTEYIQNAMKEAYQNYIKEQARPKISIRSKLAFFRERVAARDKEQQDLGIEKHNYKSDIQR